MALLLLPIFFLLPLVTLSIAHGIVLSVMWGWFMVPTFSLPAVGIVQAIGLSFVFHTFMGDHAKDEAQEARKTGDIFEAFMLLFVALFKRCLSFAMTLGCAWVVHRMM